MIDISLIPIEDFEYLLSLIESIEYNARLNNAIWLLMVAVFVGLFVSMILWNFIKKFLC